MGSANSRNQFGYVQKETSWGTIPNTTGTATVANADAFRLISLSTSPLAAQIDRPDKSGNLSAAIGINGRKSCSWRARMSLCGSGTAGTVPDIDEFLQATFNAAPTVTPGVSCTYAPADTAPGISLALWNFYDPASIIQEVAWGAIVQSMRVDFGQDVNIVEFSGEAGWSLDSNEFATADSIAKAGLTAFPARPSTPATNGNITQGFTGTITLDGQAYTVFRTGSIIYNTARELPKDTFGRFYADSPAQDVRDVRVEFDLYEDDGANFKAFTLKAKNGTPVNLIFALHAAAGNIWTWTVKNVIFDAPERDDGARKLSRRFRGKAHASSSSVTDEIGLVIT